MVGKTREEKELDAEKKHTEAVVRRRELRSQKRLSKSMRREGGKILQSDKVTEIFVDCLFNDGEDASNHVKAIGIMRGVGFHPERLESHREEIIAMLAELPDQFQQDKGGGWSFLNACRDKDGNQWTGLHSIVEQLVLLGIGIAEVEFIIPRNMWDALPGGMPYFVVKE